MFIRLGRPAALGDAVDLLLECHERIRSFLTLARRIGEGTSGDPQVVSEAALRVRRYFSEALPLHARDEEQSILPRLRGRDAGVDAELEAMAREHGEHEPLVHALVQACGDLVWSPHPNEQHAEVIARAAGELEKHFAGHLRREEEVIFPAARRLLDRASDAAIVKEIRARRTGLRPAPELSHAQGA